MLPSDLRKQLRRIAAGQVRGARAPRPEPPSVSRDPLVPEPPDVFLDPAPTLFPRCLSTSLAEALGGWEVRGSDDDPFWFIELDLTEHWPESARRLGRLRGLLAGQAGDVPQGLAPAFAAGAETLLFLDIETGGFMGNPVFLVGGLDLPSTGPRLRFWLARDMDEEIPLLERFNEQWALYRALVTYNGKAFDVPFILDRMTLWRIPPKGPPPEHVDLLHVARRLMRYDLPDFRLRTLEHHLLGRCREGDVPSDQVPQAFYEFAATRDPSIVAPILQHNAIDLVTLAELLTRFVERL